ncbi:MAG: flippase [bacterium]|nr:flippase [bacterium]
MSINIQGRLLARNAVLNLSGQVLPMIVAIVSMPFVVRGLGVERFGILSLAWAVLGYFSIFDMGLSRTTTKFVAEAMSRGKQERVPTIVWTAVIIQAVLGVLGGLVIVSVTPLLVERILNVPQNLIGEASLSFYLLALSVPAILIPSVFRGVLEATQRFDLVNTLRVLFSTANFLIPLVGLLLGWYLPGIVALLVVFRGLTLIAHFWVCLRIFPCLKVLPRSYKGELRNILGFGGWVTASNATSPLFNYLDRFLIGSLLTMNALAYYTTPWEIIVRLQILPTSLALAVFPVFSAIGAISQKKDLEHFYRRLLKYLLLLMVPAGMILALFAEKILHWWLGIDFAEKSTVVFQILAIGIPISSLAVAPSLLLQGLGRPDVRAKLLLLELPFYTVLAWFLIRKIGLPGAALARIFWIITDTLLLFGASWKICGMDIRALAGDGLLQGIAALLILSALMFTTSFLNEFLLIQVGIVFILITLFTFAIWHHALDTAEKKVIISVFSDLSGRLERRRSL